MPVHPYILRPVPPTVAILTESGEALTEEGELLDLDAWPQGVRCWASYDRVHELVRTGRGEALCWNREEIRWRHRRFEDGWRRRASDVAVIRLPFPDDEKALRALADWRDWLGSYGAAPFGTTGSAAWSLLRARLTRPLWTSVGPVPPFTQTLGGRQEIGPAGPGSYSGRLEHYDLPAAYAQELGELRYGGHWQTSDQLPSGHEPAWWAREDRPVFVHAQVKIPELPFGPLPRRPRGRVAPMLAKITAGDYPTGTRMTGVWSWQELEAAIEHGCRLLKVLEVWVHFPNGDLVQPFLPWWQAVQQGRRMPGMAGLLAKTTGNALWGRFAMDVHNNGVRSIRGRDRGHLQERLLPVQTGLPPTHDLAETVSSRTRARLYRLMMAAGERLISVHTDGAWTTAPKGPALSAAIDADTWRLKEKARRIDILDPQVLRYWPSPPRRSEPWHVVSGVPAGLAEEAFARMWQDAGYNDPFSESEGSTHGRTQTRRPAQPGRAAVHAA